MPEPLAPAYYAARSGGWRRDVWAVLHPPYTAWHLSYVLIGAAMAPTVDALRLTATLLAFFLAVGISAHALDELKGRPLGTELPGAVLSVAAAVGLLGAVGLGFAGVTRVGFGLLHSLRPASCSCSPSTWSCSAASCMETSGLRCPGAPFLC